MKLWRWLENREIKNGRNHKEFMPAGAKGYSTGKADVSTGDISGVPVNEESRLA
jgi:hypothetical protein